jgi:DNA-binding NtrC family response regulator
MKKTLIAVDDEPSILKVLDFYFGKTYNVVSKQNGKDALEWMQQGVVPDIIIADRYHSSIHILGMLVYTSSMILFLPYEANGIFGILDKI